MPTGTINSAIFRDIFGTEAMRQVWSDGNRIQKYLDFEAGARPRAGQARHHPEGGVRGNPQALQVRSVRHREAEEADRAHRLPGAAGGGAARRSLRGRSRRMVPLGRHHAGHHRHRDDHADSREPRDHREGHQRHFRRARGTRQEVPRHADGRPQQPAAGGADHLRLQDARPISPRSSATRSGSSSFASACWCSSSAARRAPSPRSARTGLRTQVELAKELDLKQPEIAWHTVHDRIAEVGCFLGLVTGICGKIAFDVKLMMQTEVEEVFEPFHEGRGSSSTMPQKRNPISCVYITAQTGVIAQPGRRAAQRHGAGPRARHRPVGDRVDRAAGDFRAHRRLPGADQVHDVGPAGRREAHARQPRHHQGPDRLGGRDDGSRPGARPAVRARPGLRHLPQGGGDRPPARRPARRERGDRQAHEQGGAAKLCDPANYLGQAGEMVDRVLALRQKG